MLVGCAPGPVPVAVPSPSESAAESACDALADALPRVVLDQPVRATDPDSPWTAAWGGPAITLRCGVARPAALVPTSELVTVNGVDWMPEQLTHGWRFTTTGRVAYVEVDVPVDYRPEVEALVDLAAAITEADPTRPDGRP